MSHAKRMLEEADFENDLERMIELLGLDEDDTAIELFRKANRGEPLTDAEQREIGDMSSRAEAAEQREHLDYLMSKDD